MHFIHCGAYLLKIRTIYKKKKKKLLPLVWDMVKLHCEIFGPILIYIKYNNINMILQKKKHVFILLIIDPTMPYSF